MTTTLHRTYAEALLATDAEERRREIEALVGAHDEQRQLALRARRESLMPLVDKHLAVQVGAAADRGRVRRGERVTLRRLMRTRAVVEHVDGKRMIYMVMNLRAV